MPLTIPAFVQYQAPMFPLRGLWNKPPPEGDFFINAEIDWLNSPPGAAVQFSVAGNSPVALSQIAALYVDNARSGANVEFIFPDSGFALTVVARAQGLYPVLTNALMFYASAPGAILGDTTILQILNSIPPPIPIIPTTAQNTASAAGVTWANGTSPLVPAGVTGTLNAISLTLAAVGGAAEEQAQVSITDGTGKTLWTYVLMVAAGATVNVPINLTGLNLRFVNGLNLVVAGSTITGGGAIFGNVYFSTP